MLQTTHKPIGDKPQSTQAQKQDAPGSTDGASSAGGVGRGNKNLSSEKLC